MSTILIHNARLLLTMNDDRQTIPAGAIFIRNQAIEWVGPTAACPPAYYQASRVIDASDKVVLPGLINTHHHLYQTLTRALAPNAGLFDWLKTLYPIWARMDGEAVYVSALVGMAELILSGCTTSSDHLYLFPNGAQLDDEIRAAQEIGLRFHAARGSMSLGESAGGLPPDSLVGAVRDAVLRVDPLQPVHNIKTLDQRIAISMEGRRAPMVLILIFALVALVLSIIGIYGVLSHMVQQRTSEIGVRMAIGANAADVQRLVLGQGARIVGYGLGLGIIGALTLSWFMQSQLFGVSSADPLTLMVVTTLLGGVALFACWLTAHRAAATQPLMALRQE